MPPLFAANATTKAEGSTSSRSAPPIHMVKGLSPMQFPREGVIPLTEKELRAQGVTFCVGKIQNQYRCLAKARESYLAQGLDPTKGPEWYYFHLKMCFETHTTANQCVIDHREKELKERRRRIREKRLSSVANFGS